MKIRNIIMSAAVALMAAAFTTPVSAAKPGDKQIGLQLYSMRTLLDDGAKYHGNLPDLLSSLSKMGYTHLEAAGYDHDNGLFYGYKPAEFAKICNKAGVKAVSSHTSRNLTADELRSGDRTEYFRWWDKTIADHKAAGMKYIVNPWMDVPATLADLQQQCDALSEVARRAKRAGLQFGYHNHSHEFQQVEGETMFDYMLAHTDPLVLFEMDVYWTMWGHAAPVEYFKKYPGRFGLLHIKDLREIGQSGMVGFDAIFNNAGLAGAKDYFLEMEAFTEDPETGAAQSARYMLDAPFVRPSYR